MNLGENIYRLRTEKHISQVELAEALEVSRQSVSKWENNNAVPDLDKLVKLAAYFGIPLDELVGGAAPTVSPAQEPAAQASAPAPSTRRTWGIVLLASGLVVFLVLSLLGGILTGLLFSAPLLVPGIICLTAKQRPGLKSAWAEYVLVSTFFTYATGASTGTIQAYLRLLLAGHDVSFFNVGHLLISVAEVLILLILLVWTVRSYNREPKVLTSRGKILLAVGWACYLLSFLPIQLPIDIFSAWYRIAYDLIHWGKILLLTVLLVFTWRLPWFRRK